MGPLADELFADPTLDPQEQARKYVNDKPAAEAGVTDVKAALDGAREILAERFAETADLLAKLRTRLREQGIVTSSAIDGKETAVFLCNSDRSALWHRGSRPARRRVSLGMEGQGAPSS